MPSYNMAFYFLPHVDPFFVHLKPHPLTGSSYFQIQFHKAPSRQVFSEPHVSDMSLILHIAAFPLLHIPHLTLLSQRNKTVSK